jgi:hypothetical protein
MGGDAGSMLANVAGRALGVLSALPSRGGGFSNLASYMARRQQAMADPNIRAALTPFGAGFYQIGGGTQAGPGTYQPVAPPADFMGPTIPTAAGPMDVQYMPGARRWVPNLPSLAPEAALEEEAHRRLVVDLQSPELATRARAKQAAKIPLTAEENQALVSGTSEFLRTAPPGSTVSIGPGGITYSVGSPYPQGTYQTPGAAALPGHLPPEQQPGGGYKPGGQLAQGEFATAAEAAAVRQPGEQTQPTGRGSWHNVKQEPTGVSPLPTTATTGAGAAAGAGGGAARVAPPPPPPPPPPAAAPRAAPPAAAAPAPAPAVPPHEVVRRLPDGTFAPVVPSPPAEGTVGYPSPAFIPAEAGGAPTVVPAAPAAAPQPVPRRAPTTVDLNAPFFRQLEAERRLSTGVLSGLAEQESGGNPQAANPKSTARGLYQITKGTAQAWGISADDRYDPVKSAIATADMLANRAKQVGIVRAVGMHYGGPAAPFTEKVGPSGLSPAQFAASVFKKAQKYAAAPPGGAEVVAFPSPAFAEPGAAAAGAPRGLPAGAPVAPPTAVPWTPAAAGAPGAPPVVVVAPPAAPAAPIAPPPGVPAGAEKFTQTQPIKPEEGGGTVTFAGEVPGGPKEPTAPRGGFNETIFLRENDIDPAKPPKGTSEMLKQAQLDFDRRQAEVKADVERRYGKLGEAQTDSLVRLRMFRSFVNTLLEEFSPEERARYVGMGGLTPYLKGGAFSQDPRFLRFRSLNAALRTSVFAEAGKAVTAPELALLAPTLPSGKEPTDASYEAALQLTTDKLDKLITGYGAQANMRIEDLAPDKQRALVEQYLSAPEAPRYGPYDWVRGGGVAPAEQRPMVTQPGQVIQGGAPAPPSSPFVVDRLYTLPPPAR